MERMKRIVMMTAVVLCLMAAPEKLLAQTQQQPAIEIIGDRTLIHVDRLGLKGDETLMDVLMMYPELLVGGFESMLDNYQLRMENVQIACNLRQYLSTTLAKTVKRIQICENPVVMKGTTGLGGVIDLNMERNEDGTKGFIGAELSTKLEKSALTAVNYGYVSPKQQTTDIYASTNVDDKSRHGDTDFSQNVSFNLTHRFTPRNRMIVYLRQSYLHNKELPVAEEGKNYTAFMYYYHTLNKIGSELLGVAGYRYSDTSSDAKANALYNDQRQAAGTQVYMIELDTPLPFLKGLRTLVGNENDLTNLRNHVRQDMVVGPTPFDVNDRFTVNNFDVYAQFDYTVGPMTFSAGDRVSFYHYGMDAYNGTASRNPTRNMVMASVKAQLSTNHQLQGGYYRRFINPSFIAALPTVYPETDGKTWTTVTTLQNERRADVYRLAYVFSKPKLNVNFGGRFVHMVDGGENTLTLNAAATWIHSWLTLTGGANYCHTEDLGEKLNYGYVRLAPTFRLPWALKASTQLVWCSKNAPERRLLDLPAVYALLKAEKNISSHVAITAQWHDIFCSQRSAALVTAKYLF